MLLKAFRYYLEYRKTEQKFKLIAIPASLVMAFGMAVIIVNAMYPPGETPYVSRLLIRLALTIYAVLSFIYELLSMRSIVTLDRPSIRLKRTFEKL